MSNPQNQSLAVTLDCTVCSGNAFQTLAITYVAADAASTEATFTITPDRSKAGDMGQGLLVFDVFGSGVVYDHIVAPVQVIRPEEEEIAIGDSSRSFQPPPEDEQPVDLQISVGWHNNAISLTFQPFGALAEALERRHLTPAGDYRIFPTRITDVNELNRLKAEAYLRLRSVTDQFGEFGKAAPPSRTAVLDGFYQAGVFLYDRLFQTADQALLSIVGTIEKWPTGSRPLRLQIDTQNIYIPWTLIHPPGPRDNARFWGQRFQIAVVPQMLARPSRLPGALKNFSPSVPGTVALLRYRRDSPLGTLERDSAAELSDELSEWFKKNVEQFSESFREPEFESVLKANRARLQLIVTFSHGSSGTVFRRNNAGSFDRIDEGDGPRLILSNLRPASPPLMLRPTDLDRIRLSFPTAPDARKPLLESEPIVLVNACETGTAGVSPTTSFDFPPAWLNFGARAVLVTESPVNAIDAYSFGTEVLERALAGRDLLDAVHERTQEWLKGDNPIGLLYTYYGNPSVSLRR